MTEKNPSFDLQSIKVNSNPAQIVEASYDNSIQFDAFEKPP
jgi:hypothetical protein